ncbi:NACHT, LRR and PYD domains-containing protein 1b allele 2-like [Oreochromis niloticus]|uniref:NACHT, LRR and PYD domains-containing protein 1b allele 2-like n=1 Tax=Oreochromis niloticus TaxID=8128 RepID=UPI000904C09E|nr:NACHT, LRR and PYD domains-containing protein 1b allele 2-like [Oreochromis niloticus]
MSTEETASGNQAMCSFILDLQLVVLLLTAFTEELRGRLRNILKLLAMKCLQSESGKYECSESALRWVCKERVCFRFQFSSWERFMKKLVCMEYIPAGPLMDIKVTDGNIEEVSLPHWIYIGKNAALSDLFRVLHVDSCGEFLEQVSEVTSSHVKLKNPNFSPRGAMFLKKLGISVKIFADVLIYMRVRTGLTLHVYLVPCDPSLQQGVEKEEKSDGFRKIRKPSPTKPLQLDSNFYLSTDSDTAEICPDKRQLTLEWSNNNFFEVVIRNYTSDFRNLTLKLECEKKKRKEKATSWTCTIGTDDYQNQSSHQEEGKHFVDRHRTALINNVSETKAILDNLLQKDLISYECYNAASGLNTTQDQMRKIFQSVTTNVGKEALYKILKEMKSLKHLMSELEGSQ